MNLKPPYRVALAVAALGAAGTAMAEENTVLENAAERIASTYREGRAEVYLPLRTFHLRSAYSTQKIEQFQETPRGLGIGRGLYDADGDWHGLYALGFQDSHYTPLWMAGYGYKTFWRPNENWKAGIGYTVFVMARSDTGHYTPFPGILPIASVSYRNFSLETSFIPGGQGYGNILFFWGKYEFGE